MPELGVPVKTEMGRRWTHLQAGAGFRFPVCSSAAVETRREGTRMKKRKVWRNSAVSPGNVGVGAKLGGTA